MKKHWESVRGQISALRSILSFPNIVGALAAALLVFLAASVWTTVEKQLDLEERLSLWLAIVIGVVALGAGILVGAIAAKRSKRTELRAEEAEKATTELELDKLRDELADLVADNRLKARTSAYIAHFQSVLDDVLRGDLTLGGFPKTRDVRLQAAFCELPSRQIEDETGHDVAVSIWIESRSKLRRGKFDVVFQANHDADELARFDVKVRGSYLRQAFDHLKEHPEASRLHKFDNLDGSSDFGDDIAAFRASGYRSLRAFAVDFGGKPVRLVALSKQAHTFSQFEDRYLLLLWCAMEVAARLAPTFISSTPSTIVPKGHRLALPQTTSSEQRNETEAHAFDPNEPTG